MQGTETYSASEKQHSKTWLAMQKYRGIVTVYDKSLFGIYFHTDTGSFFYFGGK